MATVKTLSTLLEYVSKHMGTPSEGPGKLYIESTGYGFRLVQETANRCTSDIHHYHTKAGMEAFLRGAIMVADFHDRYPGGSAVRKADWFEVSA